MRVLESLVIESLHELADVNYQQRVWSGSDPQIMSSLTECFAQLFDDSGLAEGLEGGSVFNRSIDQKLRLLGDCLSRVDATQAIPGLLCDTSFTKARKLAAEILTDLAHKASPSNS